jgi:hypothetical protein
MLSQPPPSLPRMRPCLAWTPSSCAHTNITLSLQRKLWTKVKWKEPRIKFISNPQWTLEESLIQLKELFGMLFRNELPWHPLENFSPPLSQALAPTTTVLYHCVPSSPFGLVSTGRDQGFCFTILPRLEDHQGSPPPVAFEQGSCPPSWPYLLALPSSATTLVSFPSRSSSLWPPPHQKPRMGASLPLRSIELSGAATISSHTSPYPWPKPPRATHCLISG